MGPLRATAASLEKRRLGLALALAVGLHLLVLTLLPEPTRPDVPGENSPPLIVELRETLPRIVTPPAPGPTDEPAARPLTRRAGSKAARQALPRLEPSGRSTDAGKAQPSEGESARSPAIDLFDADALAGGLTLPHQTGPAGRGDAGDGNSPAEERARVSGRIESDIEDSQAQARVRNGLVDPWFRKMAGRFKEAWQPSASAVDGSGSGAAGHLGSFVGQWQAAGEQYAATGSPFPGGTQPSGPNVRPPDLRPGNGLSAFDLEDFRIRWNDGQFAATGAIVLVRLEQNSSGLPLRVELLQSSGSASLDGSAMETVRGLAGSVPAPEHGLGLGGPVIRSVWRFHARVVSNTCTPVLDQTGQGLGSLAGVVGLGCGGTFDLATGEADPQLPFERRVVSTVELMALYGGAVLPFDASAGSGNR